MTDQENSDIFGANDEPQVNSFAGIYDASEQEAFDFDAFIGNDPLPEGRHELRLLNVKSNAYEIRLTFVHEAYTGVATEMFSKTSAKHGWLLGKWMRVFDIPRPVNGATKEEVFEHFEKHLQDCIGQDYDCDVTKADQGDTLYNAVTIQS